jgi:hypothetical protein
MIYGKKGMFNPNDEDNIFRLFRRSYSFIEVSEKYGLHLEVAFHLYRRWYNNKKHAYMEMHSVAYTEKHELGELLEFCLRKVLARFSYAHKIQAFLWKMPITRKKDLDSLIKTNDGKYIIFECKNINTQGKPYSEKSTIIQTLPNRRKRAQSILHVDIEKYVLIITNCLSPTAKTWLKKNDIPIIEVGEQITFKNRLKRIDEIVKVLEVEIPKFLSS